MIDLGKEQPWGWWWPKKPPKLAGKPPRALYGYELYTPPPKRLRYTLERWSFEDQREDRWAGETYAHTYCVACYGTLGAFCIGEYVIDDSLSADFYHIRCAPRRIRAKAWLGTLVCTLRAVLCIDRFAKHVV